MSNIDKHGLLGVPKHANQHRLSRLTMEVHTDELRIMASAVESYTDELIAALEAAENRIAELEARQPYGYLRENDGQIQISIGSNRPHDRSGGCATPWFAIYTAAGTAKGG